MDKIEKVRSYLKDLKEITASDLQSIDGIEYFQNTITHIDSLLTGCIDNDDVIVFRPPTRRLEISIYQQARNL